MSIVRPAGHVRFTPTPRALPRVLFREIAHAFRLALSANIASGGEATTDYGMTAPAGKSGSDFTTGRRWNDENGSDALTIAVDDWTKVGWSITPISGVVVDTEQYEFRIVADGVALDTYTITPRWTIGTPVGDVELPSLLMQPMRPQGYR